MNSIRHCRGLALGLSFLLLIAAADAEETLLFSDNFDIGSNADINASLDLRQTGTLSPSTYTDLDAAAGYGAVAEIYADQLWLTAPYVSESEPWLKAKATVGLDANFSGTVGGRFTVEAFMSLDDIGGDNWAAVTLDGTKDADLPGASAVSIVIRPDTTYDLWVNGTKVIDENNAAHGLFSGLEHDIHFTFDDAAQTFDLTVDAATVVSGQTCVLPNDRYLMLQSFAVGTTGGVDATHAFDDVEVRLLESGGPIEPIEPEEIAHWNFDVDLTDSVGDNHGTAFNGASLSADAKVGSGSLALEKASNQYVSIDGVAGELAEGDSSTLMYWFKTSRQGDDMVHNGDNVVFAANGADGADNYYRTGTGVNGGIYWNPTNISGATPDEEGGTGMNDGEWHFVALVMDESGRTTAYTDASGSLEEVTGFTDYPSQPHWGSAQTFSFGQEWDGATPTNFYDGLIDDVSLWKGALSLTEIQALYDAAVAGGETLEGDLNGDGAVGSADLDIVRGAWGETVEAGNLAQGDPSGDGIVGSADLDIIRANWGRTASAAVPEPGVLSLLLACFAAYGMLRRR